MEERPGPAIMELLAGPDVQKLGMVCALPPKPLQVRQVAPGGWAEECGVLLGDVVVEVNGIPACEFVAEDLKQAMIVRPLSFRIELAAPARAQAAATKAAAVVKLQAACRRRLAINYVTARRTEQKAAETEAFRHAAATRIQSWQRGVHMRSAKRALEQVTWLETQEVDHVPLEEAVAEVPEVWKVLKGPDEEEVAMTIQRSLPQDDEQEAAMTIQRSLRGWSTRRRSTNWMPGMDCLRSLDCTAPAFEAMAHSKSEPVSGKSQHKAFEMRKKAFESLSSEQCFEDVSNDAQSTTGTEQEECDIFSSCCDNIDIDARSWQQDSRRPSVISAGQPSSPSVDLQDSRAVPGFSLETESCRAVPGFSLETSEILETQDTPVSCGRELKQAAALERLLGPDSVTGSPQDFDPEAAGDGEASWTSECEDSYSMSCGVESGHLPENIILVEAFKVVMLNKEHGFVRAWRNILDPAGRGRITFAELCEGCRRLGFRGSIRDLWRQLDPMDLAGITLQELDYDSAETLGRFHSALVARYGSVRGATKAFGLAGARRLQQAEFCSLMRSQCFMRKHEAGALFRTLCTCPPASALDRDAGISVRDFEWLHGVSKHLPDILPERVQPGMAPGSTNADFYEMPESLADSEDDVESNTGSTVFDKLYQKGIELNERRRVMAEGPAAEDEVHGPVDPHRFDRLYQEAQVKREEQERRTEDFYRQQFPQQGPKQRNDKVWERLVKPKENSGVVEEVGDIRPDRSTCWDPIPIAQIRTACEQEGFDCKGKTKEELLKFLKQVQHRQPAKAVPKATLRQNKLYSDHQRHLNSLEEKRQKAAAKEEKAIQDMQMKPARAVRKNLHEHLYAEAQRVEKRRQEEAEKATAKIDAQLLQPARAPAKMETFLRLYTDNHDRDAKVDEKRRQLEREAESQLQEGSIHKNKTADPGVFDRLYNNDRRGDEASTIDEDSVMDEEELPPHLLEATYDTVWKTKGAGRPAQDELKELLRKKIESVEQVQGALIKRGSITCGALLKRGPRSSSGSSIPGPGRSTAASKKQAPAADARVDPVNRKFLSSEAGLLRDFAKFFFGCLPTSDAAMDAFDMNKTGRLSMAAFIGGMKRLRYLGDSKSVFRALDVDCLGYIGKTELQVLNRFHPHAKVEVEVSRTDPTPSKSASKLKPPGHLASRLKQKSGSSSTPSLASSDADSQAASSSQAQASAYPYKGSTRMATRNAYMPALVEQPASRPSMQPPRKGRAPRSSDAGASGVSSSESQFTEAAPIYEKQPSKGFRADAGKTTPSFGELGPSSAWPSKHKWSPTVPSDTTTDIGSRATEMPLLCDDELLDIEASESSSNSGSSDSSDSSDSSCSSQNPTQQQEASSFKPKPSAASSRPGPGPGTESSTGSNCSTPRSLELDTESMPWQEGPRASSSASSASGAASGSGSGATWPASSSASGQDPRLHENGNLQAEVRQLLLEYKLDNGRALALPEAKPGSLQQRPAKDVQSGPELSCRSAWIHPDTLVAQKA